jgi:hypothetical protein
MSEYPASEYPIDSPPAAHASLTSSTTHWAPLLPRAAFVGLLGLGLVVGIAGPILLWLNLLPNRPSFVEEVGFLVVLMGIGLVVISLPLLLGEAGRLERSSADASVGRSDAGFEPARGMTGTRVFALVGVAVLLAGSFLLRPVEPSEDSSGGGSSQGGGGQGGGR